LRCLDAPDYDALFRKIGVRVLQLIWIVGRRWQDSGPRVCVSASGTSGAQLLHFVRSRGLYLLVGTSFRRYSLLLSTSQSAVCEKSQYRQAGEHD
jgi:hypothetical protein